MTLRARARGDRGVSEVVSYTLMFALGATALGFSMQMFVDTQQHGARISTAQQANGLGQATAAAVQDAALVAHQAPNATFNTTIELPEVFTSHNLTVHLSVPGEPDRSQTASWTDFWDPTVSPGCPTDPKVLVSTQDSELDATVRLGNQTTAHATDSSCLILDTEEKVTSALDSFRVVYEMDDGNPTGNDRPTISLQPPKR